MVATAEPPHKDSDVIDRNGLVRLRRTQNIIR